MYIDTHAHLDDKRFNDSSIESIINEAKKEKVEKIIIPAINLESCQLIEKLVNNFPELYFAGGIHCHEVTDGFCEQKFQKIKKIINNNPKAIAIGEVGLDYYYDFAPKTLQKHILGRFLDLSEKLNLPLILHCREAENDMHEMLKSYNGKLKGVVHCYTGNLEWAKKFVKLGFYIGFTGIITFPKSNELREVVKWVPEDRILTETDSPYMTPVPHRGKTNHPGFIPLIAEQIAKIKSVELVKIAPVLLENAEKCFNLN